MEIIGALFLVVFTTWIIAKACDGFEVAANYLGRNMSEGVKGATINAIGSSMPELFVILVFLFIYSNTTGFAGGIGTTAGSAVFNTMVIPAFSILVALKIFNLSSIHVSKKVILRDGLMLIAVEFILIVTIQETLEWWHGMMLMLLYAAYAGYMLISMKKNIEQVSEDGVEQEEVGQRSRITSLFIIDLEHAVIGENKLTNRNSLTLLILSIFFIAIACYFLVEAAELFATQIGIASYFVAVIVIAAASSVPDTILSIKDAKNGNYDDAVSNALGSNIFDICIALGFPLFLYTIMYGPITISANVVSHVVELRLLLLFLTIGAFFIFYFGGSMGKKKAYALLTMYTFFTVFIVSRAYDMQWIEPVARSLHLIQQYL